MVDKSRALQIGDIDVECINKKVGFEPKWELSFIGWVGLGRKVLKRGNICIHIADTLHFREETSATL